MQAHRRLRGRVFAAESERRSCCCGVSSTLASSGDASRFEEGQEGREEMRGGEWGGVCFRRSRCSRCPSACVAWQRLLIHEFIQPLVLTREGLRTAVAQLVLRLRKYVVPSPALRAALRKTVRKFGGDERLALPKGFLPRKGVDASLTALEEHAQLAAFPSGSLRSPETLAGADRRGRQPACASSPPARSSRAPLRAADLNALLKRLARLAVPLREGFRLGEAERKAALTESREATAGAEGLRRRPNNAAFGVHCDEVLPAFGFLAQGFSEQRSKVAAESLSRSALSGEWHRDRSRRLCGSVFNSPLSEQPSFAVETEASQGWIREAGGERKRRVILRRESRVRSLPLCLEGAAHHPHQLFQQESSLSSSLSEALAAPAGEGGFASENAGGCHRRRRRSSSEASQLSVASLPEAAQAFHVDCARVAEALQTSARLAVATQLAKSESQAAASSPSSLLLNKTPLSPEKECRCCTTLEIIRAASQLVDSLDAWPTEFGFLEGSGKAKRIQQSAQAASVSAPHRTLENNSLGKVGAQRPPRFRDCKKRTGGGASASGFEQTPVGAAFGSASSCAAREALRLGRGGASSLPTSPPTTSTSTTSATTRTATTKTSSEAESPPSALVFVSSLAAPLQVEEDHSYFFSARSLALLHGALKLLFGGGDEGGESLGGRQASWPSEERQKNFFRPTRKAQTPPASVGRAGAERLSEMHFLQREETCSSGRPFLPRAARVCDCCEMQPPPPCPAVPSSWRSSRGTETKSKRRLAVQREGKSRENFRLAGNCDEDGGVAGAS